jgi:hypothetical protein
VYRLVSAGFSRQKRPIVAQSLTAAMLRLQPLLVVLLEAIVGCSAARSSNAPPPPLQRMPQIHFTPPC